jgi:hypothetical protein
VSFSPSLMMSLFKESMKIKKQKILMKNVIKNKIKQDIRMKELKMRMLGRHILTLSFAYAETHLCREK